MNADLVEINICLFLIACVGMGAANTALAVWLLVKEIIGRGPGSGGGMTVA